LSSLKGVILLEKRFFSKQPFLFLKQLKIEPPLFYFFVAEKTCFFNSATSSKIFT